MITAPTFSAGAGGRVNDWNSEVTLTVAATDLAGNGGANVAVVVDRAGPTVSVTDRRITPARRRR